MADRRIGMGDWRIGIVVWHYVKRLANKVANRYCGFRIGVGDMRTGIRRRRTGIYDRQIGMADRRKDASDRRIGIVVPKRGPDPFWFCDPIWICDPFRFSLID